METKNSQGVPKMGQKKPKEAKVQSESIEPIASPKYPKVKLQEISRVTGLSYSWLKDIMRGHVKDGQIDPLEAIYLLVSYYRGSDIKKQIELKRLEVLEEQRKKMELERRKREGELVEIDAVIQVWASIFATIRERLLQLPAKLAPMVASADIPETKKTLEQEITNVLAELKEDVTNEIRKASTSG